jgi:hypothetical protein
MVEKREATASMDTSLNIFLRKSDQHFAIANIDNVINLEKNNENVFVLPKTQ